MSVRIDWREIVLPFLVTHIDSTEAGEELAVASVTGRHDAVEHIDASFDPFQQIDRGTYAHQVTRLIFRQDLVYDLDHLIHLIGRLANGQSPDSVSIGAFSGHVLRRPLPQVRIDASLYDREETLPVAVFRLRAVEAGETTIQPTLGQAQ